VWKLFVVLALLEAQPCGAKKRRGGQAGVAAPPPFPAQPCAGRHGELLRARVIFRGHPT